MFGTKNLIAVAVMAILFTGIGTASSRADVFDFSFSGSTPGGASPATGPITAIGTFTATLTATPDEYDVTAISGTLNGAAITGLSAPASTWYVNSGADNELFFPTPPNVDSPGISFTTASDAYNLAYNGGYEVISQSASSDAYYTNGTYGTLTVTEDVSGVPEISTWAMMLIGFGFVGLQLKRRNTVRSLSA